MKTPRQIFDSYIDKVSRGESSFHRSDPRESLGFEVTFSLDEDFHVQFIEPAVKAMWKRMNLNNDRRFRDIDIDEFDHYAIAFSNALDAYMKQLRKFNKTGWHTG